MITKTNPRMWRAFSVLILLLLGMCRPAAGEVISLDANYVADSLTINTDDTFITNGYDLDIGSGGIGIKTGGALDASSGVGGDTLITDAGDWSNAGTFTAGSSTVTFDGTSGIDAGGTGPAKAFNNVQLNGTTATLSTSDIDIDGDFTITSGTWNANGFEIYVSGDWTNNGTFDPGGGTVILTGGTTTLSSGGTGAGKAFNHLTIEGSAVVLMTYDIDINGNLTISSGSLEVGALEMYVGGNWTNSGTLDAGISTITLDGTSMVDSGGVGLGKSFYNLILDGAGATLTNNDVEIAGDFTITSGVWDCNDLNMSVGGDWTNSGTFTPGSSTVTFQGSSDSSVSGSAPTSFYDLKVAKNDGSNKLILVTGNCSVLQWTWVDCGTLDFSDADVTFTCADNIEFSQGGLSSRLSMDADDVLDCSGSLVLNSGATENITGGTIRLTGSMEAEPAVDFTPTGGTVEFYDGSAADINMIPSASFYNVTINKTPGVPVKVKVPLSVDGDLTITSGTLDANGADVNVAGDWTNNGTFEPGGATVTFGGGSSTINSGGIGAGKAFDNLHVTSGGCTVTAPGVVINGKLFISPGATFEITEGGSKLYTGEGGAVDVDIDGTMRLQLMFASGNIYWYAADGSIVDLSPGGTLTLDGYDSTNRIYLRSAVDGNPWYLNDNTLSSSNPLINYVDVKDSDASGGYTVYADDGTNVDSGNNVNWNFPVGPGTIYVDADAVGGNNGTSWADAYKFLQDALAVAHANDQIWVAEGTYKPDANAAYPEGTGERTATFQLVSGLSMYGGFPSGGGSWAQRDPWAYTTRLSGDLHGNDVPGLDPCDLLSDPNRADNSFHVVTANDVNSVVLDGFTIYGGNANGVSPDCNGGGLFSVDSNITVANCSFSECSASGDGGACSYDFGSPTPNPCGVVQRCGFCRNYAARSGGAMIVSRLMAPITISGGTFSYNTANANGGGIYNFLSDPNITNCTFTRNSANNSGGGIYNSDSDPNITNCILWGNVDGVSPAEQAQIYDDATSSSTVKYSCIEGWDSAGVGNINEPPQFVDANGPDGEPGTDDDNLRLMVMSPCVDAGDSNAVPAEITTDIAGNPRFTDNPAKADTGTGTEPIVDMGAYELRHIYVDCNVVGGQMDGTSWANAHFCLQDGLADAEDGGAMVFVAEGTYKPDVNSNYPWGSGLQTETFQLVDGVGLYGGFPSGGGTWSQRDRQAYSTILSGDLDGNDATNLDPCDLLNHPTRADNSYNIITAMIARGSLVDGFGIHKACSFGIMPDDSNGGGMWCYDSGITVTNCDFWRCAAAGDGGAVWSSGWSEPRSFTYCTFRENVAAAKGGGMYNYNTNTTVTNCSFRKNAASKGSAMYNDKCDVPVGSTAPSITGTSFDECNVTLYFPLLDGGGIYNHKSDPNITNCTFTRNSVSNKGGGIYNSDSDPNVKNCILWGNADGVSPAEQAQIYDDATSSSTVKYSCVEGLNIYAGNNNIADNPLFLADIPDQVRLLATSPCIDAGDNNSVPVDVTTDIEGHPRIADGDCNDSNVVDMGAYEFAWVYAGDFDTECDVDFADWALFALAWLTEQGQLGYISDYDISSPPDNKIDWADARILCDNWLAHIEP